MNDLQSRQQPSRLTSWLDHTSENGRFAVKGSQVGNHAFQFELFRGGEPDQPLTFDTVFDLWEQDAG